MYAIVRLNHFDPALLDDGAAQLEEFDRLHAEQPGFVGSLVVDLDAGRRVVVNLWESEERAKAGLRVLGPAVGRLVAPLMSSPSELIGIGNVIRNDLVPD